MEVTWPPEIAHLRASHVVTVIDGDHMINPCTARNQIEGAVVMGVGMAMLKATEYDQRTARQPCSTACVPKSPNENIDMPSMSSSNGIALSHGFPSTK